MLVEQTFNANGVFINYAVGPALGTPLVLLHGITERWQAFTPLISHLTARWQVYALDLRGHGHSMKVKNSYAIVDYAEDIFCLLESQINEPAVILGHSLGALISIYIAASRPKLVKSIILVDPPLHLQHTPLKDIPNGPYETFKQIVEIIQTSQFPHTIEQSLIKLFPEVDPNTHRATAEVLSQLDPDALIISLENQHLAGLNLDTLLTQVKCPTLLIQGNPELGAALFDDDVNRALTLLQHGTWMNVPDGGHMLQQSHPETIANELNKFLDQRV